ncbi:MAG: hypothetical protein ACP5GD_03240 [Candidatus Micrarchaeia archaeon]
MDGEFIGMYIYDTDKTFEEERVKNLLRQPEDFSKYEYTAPAPEELPTFSLPQVFNLGEGEVKLRDKVLKTRQQVAIYSIGSFSIRIRILFEGAERHTLEMLAFDKDVERQLSQIAERARKRVENALAKLYPEGIEVSNINELYYFYYLNISKQEGLENYKSLIAGMLIDEPNAEELDADYLNYTLSKNISYASDDAFYVGWEGAVLLDKSRSYDYELLVAEIANVQLLKFRTYKDKVSALIQKTTAEVTAIGKMGFFSRIFTKKAEKLNMVFSEFENEMTYILNWAENTVFSMGEWYLSRLYGLFASSFRLNELKDSLTRDAGTLSARKSLIIEQLREKDNDILEFIIILLILVELLIELMQIFVISRLGH